MLKEERNRTIFFQVISGKTLQSIAQEYQLCRSTVKNIVFFTYAKVCREKGFEPLGWTIDVMRQDTRITL